MTLNLESRIPEGPLADKWQNYIANQKLVNPSNKRKFKIIVVGNCSMPIAVQAGIVSI
jgi:succinate dehydrogenase / fumarate reductase flavoprotein subunit